VALVTGGAVRLGRSITLGLARAGWDVAIHFGSSEREAGETARAVAELDRASDLIRADLRLPSAAESVATAVQQRFGRLDLLVNSAASFRTGELLEVDAEEWDEVMAINLRAPHLLVRACADLLRASRGSVVNITDLSAFQAWTEYPHHAVSKAALAHLTRVQARALAPEIRVNAIAPGAVLPPADWDAERWETLARRAALERTGSPEDVVGAVLYLADATFVTGHVLPVDGGRLLGPRGPADRAGDR
jgi:pteridine reductase